MAGFLLNVCHVVLYVYDWFIDLQVIKFLQTAEMLKPSSPAMTESGNPDELIEYFPNVIFVQNKASLSDFSPDRIETMEEVLSKLMDGTQLKIKSNLGTSDSGFNLTILPDLDSQRDGKLIRVSLEEKVNWLRRLVFSSNRSHLTTMAKLTEKNWFVFAQKMWDAVKNSSFYLEYSRLL